jgi:hypothetical protein
VQSRGSRGQRSPARVQGFHAFYSSPGASRAISLLHASIRSSTRSPVVSLPDWFDKFGGPDVETVGQLHDIHQADVALPTLDSADIVPVKVS